MTFEVKMNMDALSTEHQKGEDEFFSPSADGQKTQREALKGKDQRQTALFCSNDKNSGTCLALLSQPTYSVACSSSGEDVGEGVSNQAMAKSSLASATQFNPLPAGSVASTAKELEIFDMLEEQPTNETTVGADRKKGLFSSKRQQQQAHSAALGDTSAATTNTCCRVAGVAADAAAKNLANKGASVLVGVADAAAKNLASKGASVLVGVAGFRSSDAETSEFLSVSHKINSASTPASSAMDSVSISNNRGNGIHIGVHSSSCTNASNGVANTDNHSESNSENGADREAGCDKCETAHVNYEDSTANAAEDASSTRGLLSRSEDVEDAEADIQCCSSKAEDISLAGAANSDSPPENAGRQQTCQTLLAGVATAATASAAAVEEDCTAPLISVHSHKKAPPLPTADDVNETAKKTDEHFREIPTAAESDEYSTAAAANISVSWSRRECAPTAEIHNAFSCSISQLNGEQETSKHINVNRKEALQQRQLASNEGAGVQLTSHGQKYRQQSQQGQQVPHQDVELEPPTFQHQEGDECVLYQSTMMGNGDVPHRESLKVGELERNDFLSATKQIERHTGEEREQLQIDTTSQEVRAPAQGLLFMGERELRLLRLLRHHWHQLEEEQKERELRRAQLQHAQQSRQPPMEKQERQHIKQKDGLDSTEEQCQQQKRTRVPPQEQEQKQPLQQDTPPSENEQQGSAHESVRVDARLRDISNILPRLFSLLLQHEPHLQLSHQQDDVVDGRQAYLSNRDEESQGRLGTPDADMQLRSRLEAKLKHMLSEQRKACWQEDSLLEETRCLRDQLQHLTAQQAVMQQQGLLLQEQLQHMNEQRDTLEQQRVQLRYLQRQMRLRQAQLRQSLQQQEGVMDAWTLPPSLDCALYDFDCGSSSGNEEIADDGELIAASSSVFFRRCQGNYGATVKRSCSSISGNKETGSAQDISPKLENFRLSPGRQEQLESRNGENADEVQLPNCEDDVNDKEESVLNLPLLYGWSSRSRCFSDDLSVSVAASDKEKSLIFKPSRADAALWPVKDFSRSLDVSYSVDNSDEESEPMGSAAAAAFSGLSPSCISTSDAKKLLLAAAAVPVSEETSLSPVIQQKGEHCRGSATGQVAAIPNGLGTQYLMQSWFTSAPCEKDGRTTVRPSDETVEVRQPSCNASPGHFNESICPATYNGSVTPFSLDSSKVLQSQQADCDIKQQQKKRVEDASTSKQLVVISEIHAIEQQQEGLDKPASAVARVDRGTTVQDATCESTFCIKTEQQQQEPDRSKESIQPFQQQRNSLDKLEQEEGGEKQVSKDAAECLEDTSHFSKTSQTCKELPSTCFTTDSNRDEGDTANLSNLRASASVPFPNDEIRLSRDSNNPSAAGAHVATPVDPMQQSTLAASQTSAKLWRYLCGNMVDSKLVASAVKRCSSVSLAALGSRNIEWEWLGEADGSSGHSSLDAESARHHSNDSQRWQQGTDPCGNPYKYVRTADQADKAGAQEPFSLSSADLVVSVLKASGVHLPPSAVELACKEGEKFLTDTAEAQQLLMKNPEERQLPLITKPPLPGAILNSGSLTHGLYNGGNSFLPVDARETINFISAMRQSSQPEDEHRKKETAEEQQQEAFPQTPWEHRLSGKKSDASASALPVEQQVQSFVGDKEKHCGANAAATSCRSLQKDRRIDPGQSLKSGISSFDASIEKLGGNDAAFTGAGSLPNICDEAWKRSAFLASAAQMRWFGTSVQPEAETQKSSGIAAPLQNVENDTHTWIEPAQLQTKLKALYSNHSSTAAKPFDTTLARFPAENGDVTKCFGSSASGLPLKWDTYLHTQRGLHEQLQHSQQQEREQQRQSKIDGASIMYAHKEEAPLQGVKEQHQQHQERLVEEREIEDHRALSVVSLIQQLQQNCPVHTSQQQFEARGLGQGYLGLSGSIYDSCPVENLGGADIAADLSTECKASASNIPDCMEEAKLQNKETSTSKRAGGSMVFPDSDPLEWNCLEKDNLIQDVCKTVRHSSRSSSSSSGDSGAVGDVAAGRAAALLAYKMMMVQGRDILSENTLSSCSKNRDTFDSVIHAQAHAEMSTEFAMASANDSPKFRSVIPDVLGNRASMVQQSSHYHVVEKAAVSLDTTRKNKFCNGCRGQGSGRDGMHGAGARGVKRIVQGHVEQPYHVFQKKQQCSLMFSPVEGRCRGRHTSVYPPRRAGGAAPYKADSHDNTNSFIKSCGSAMSAARKTRSHGYLQSNNFGEKNGKQQPQQSYFPVQQHTSGRRVSVAGGCGQRRDSSISNSRKDTGQQLEEFVPSLGLPGQHSAASGEALHGKVALAGSDQEDNTRDSSRDGEPAARNMVDEGLSGVSKCESTNGFTTVMLRNIPNKYSRRQVMDEINVKFKGLYNFFYLPIDFAHGCNVGYCFINFLDVATAQAFRHEFEGKRLGLFRSRKICTVTYGRVQGLKAISDHYLNSAVVQAQDESWRPVVLKNGVELAWSELREAFPEMFDTNGEVRTAAQLTSGGSAPRTVKNTSTSRVATAQTATGQEETEGKGGVSDSWSEASNATGLKSTSAAGDRADRKATTRKSESGGGQLVTLEEGIEVGAGYLKKNRALEGEHGFAAAAAQKYVPIESNRSAVSSGFKAVDGSGAWNALGRTEFCNTPPHGDEERQDGDARAKRRTSVGSTCVESATNRSGVGSSGPVATSNNKRSAKLGVTIEGRRRELRNRAKAAAAAAAAAAAQATGRKTIGPHGPTFCRGGANKNGAPSASNWVVCTETMETVDSSNSGGTCSASRAAGSGAAAVCGFATEWARKALPTVARCRGFINNTKGKKQGWGGQPFANHHQHQQASSAAGKGNYGSSTYLRGTPHLAAAQRQAPDASAAATHHPAYNRSDEENNGFSFLAGNVENSSGTGRGIRRIPPHHPATSRFWPQRR